jgi:hypothetical protein
VALDRADHSSLRLWRLIMVDDTDAAEELQTGKRLNRKHAEDGGMWGGGQEA